MLQRKHLSLTFLDLAPAARDHAPLMILLHGYGSNEKDLIQLAPMLHEGLRYSGAPHAALARAGSDLFHCCHNRAAES